MTALETFELRDTASIDEAQSGFLRWACQGWDHCGGDVDGALAYAYESFVENGVTWAEEPRTFYAEFPFPVRPIWNFAEFALVVALTLTDYALAAFQTGTKRGLGLAAILYGEAIEAKQYWWEIRGPAKARNTEIKMGIQFREAREALRQRELALARKENALRAARTKLDNDPKQAAKSEALLLWRERQAGRHPRLRTNEQFAMECMRRWPVLTSSKVICGWCTQWAKSGKSQ